jgi:hypothetical protein
MAYSWVSAATMAGDARGKELLHALEEILGPDQIARGRERAIGLESGSREYSASMFGQ